MMFRIRCEVVNHVTKSSDYDWVDLPVSSVIAMATTLEETAVAEPADDPAVGLLTPPFLFCIQESKRTCQNWNETKCKIALTSIEMHVQGLHERPDSQSQPGPPAAMGGMVVDPNWTPLAALSNLTISASIFP